MTPEQTVDGALVLLVVAAITGAASVGMPALWQWFKAKLSTAAEREKQALDEDKTDERLDNETRDITNKLALKAFDIQERLQRLQAEYVEQGLLVKSQLTEIGRLTNELANERIAKEEYQRQVTELLNELTRADALIKQLRNEILILESMLNTSEG